MLRIEGVDVWKPCAPGEGSKVSAISKRVSTLCGGKKGRGEEGQRRLSLARSNPLMSRPRVSGGASLVTPPALESVPRRVLFVNVQRPDATGTAVQVLRRVMKQEHKPMPTKFGRFLTIGRDVRKDAVTLAAHAHLVCTPHRKVDIPVVQRERYVAGGVS